MNNLTIALVAALSFTSVGCKKQGGDAIAKLEGFQKSMCECKDKACADKVNADMTAWGTEAAKTAGKDDNKDPELAKKSTEIMTKYSECMTKLATAGGGDAPKPPDGKPAHDPAPTASGGTCPEGFTHNKKSDFCIKLPAGVKGEGGAGMEVGNNKALQYSWAGGEKGSDFGISVKVWAMSEHYPDNLKAVGDPPYKGKAVAEGKIGDTGAWGSGESGPPPDGHAQRHYINAVNKNDKMQIACNISRASGTGSPSEEEVFEACKTIAFAK